MQTIFSQHLRTFEQERGEGLSPHEWLALRKITACRTPLLGGHLHACVDCGCEHEIWHSCNHRLCPQCGAHEAHEWCERQSENLLPDVAYFMVTCTLPATLREYSRRDERTWYDWLFHASSSALMELMADDKDLGGQAGFFGVLQTWKRDLGYHPHIHYVVPGGVLEEEKCAVPGSQKLELHRKWKHVRSGPSGPYLLNAYAVQKAIRMRMEKAVREAQPELYASIPRSVWREAWRVDIRHVGSGQEVIRYLARYVTKSAISNAQLISSDATSVTYTFTPNGGKRSQYKTLGAHEFMAQVLQHALPQGFKRIRYFGWQHPSAKKRLEQVKLLVGKPLVYKQQSSTQEQDEPDAASTALWQPRCRQCQGERFAPREPIPPLTPLKRRFYEIEHFGPSPPPKRAKRLHYIRPNQLGGRAPPQSTCETSPP